MRSLVAMLENKLVNVAVSANRPTNAGDGVSILDWRTNGEFSSPIAALFLDGTVAQTISSPTGGNDGVELWGYRLSQWWLIGVLNDGADIVIVGSGQGRALEVDIIGIFEDLAIAGTCSAGSNMAGLAPIQTWETP